MPQSQTATQTEVPAAIASPPLLAVCLSLLVAMFVVYLFGVIALTRRESLKGPWAVTLTWFRPIHFSRYGDRWLILLLAALFWTLPILLGSVLGARILKFDIIQPGVVFLLGGVVFTVASLANTIALLKQRMRHIGNFVDFFYRLDEEFREIHSRNQRQHDPDEPTELVYLLDYTPLIGEISKPRIRRQMFNLLSNFVHLPYCEGHFVFLPSKEFVDGGRGDLERFYRRFTSSDAGAAQHAEEANREISKLDADFFAVWRSRRIHSEHYFVTVDSALTYYVTPEPDGKRNELSGEVTEDVNRVKHIQEIVKDYIAEAVTPDIDWLNGKLGLRFRVGQENIEQIEVYYGSEQTDMGSDSLRRKPNPDETIPVSDEGKVNAGQVYECQNLRSEHRWLRVRLKKKSRTLSGQPQEREPKPVYSELSYILPIEYRQSANPPEEKPAPNPQVTAIRTAITGAMRRRMRAMRIRNIAAGQVTHLRAVIEFTNVCHHNCLYCGMRAQNQTLPRFVMQAEEILDCARKARNDGIETIMIQGGDHLKYDVSHLCDVVRTIRHEFRQTVLLCLGDRPIRDYELLREAGATEAIVKFEASNEEAYRHFRPHSRLQDRLALIRTLANMGYQISSGFILGLPGTSGEDTKRDLELVSTLLSEMSLFAASVSPFIPNDQSPLANEQIPKLDAALDCIARLRIIGPKLRIPAVSALNLLAAREGRKEPGQFLGLQAGANVLTINYTPAAMRHTYVIYTTNRSIVELEYAKKIAAEARLTVG